MNIDKIKKLGFVSKVDINQGIRKTIEWFKSNNNNHEKRYNSFLEN